MELATIFLIWLAITVIDNLAKRKKRHLPPPQSPPDFDIPTLANDPNLPGEEIPIFIETPAQVEVRPKNPTPPPTKKKVEQLNKVDTSDELALNLTPSTVMNTFIFAELIDKPKALRRRYR